MRRLPTRAAPRAGWRDRRRRHWRPAAALSRTRTARSRSAATPNRPARRDQLGTALAQGAVDGGVAAIVGVAGHLERGFAAVHASATARSTGMLESSSSARPGRNSTGLARSTASTWLLTGAGGAHHDDAVDARRRRPGRQQPVERPADGSVRPGRRRSAPRGGRGPPQPTSTGIRRRPPRRRPWRRRSAPRALRRTRTRTAGRRNAAAVR
jgi:hypothetical protein